jgi:microcystin-dependent protein
MSTGYVIPSPKFRAFDHGTGAPLAGGKLSAFAAGTSTPQNTYSDQALTTPNANPVVLDSNGEASIYIPDSTLYKFVLKDSTDVVQWTVDNVSMPSPTAGTPAAAVATGAILPYGGTAAPTGYLLCDGSAVSRTTFSALFTVLGTAFGAGDGSTTFNLPDLRGRFPLGKAAAGTGSSLAGTGGSLDHTHTGPSHTHGVTVTRDGWGSALSTPGTTGRMQTGNAGGAGPDASEYMATTDVTVTSAAGGTGATGTSNPAFISLNYLVKT